MGALLKGFRDFAFKDDLIAAAVGLVMALATFQLIQAIVGGLLTPLIAAIIGETSFLGLTFTIGGAEFGYGIVLNELITFLPHCTSALAPAS